MLEFRLQKYLVNFRRVLKGDRGIKFWAGICAGLCTSTVRHYPLFSSSTAFIFFSTGWRKSFQTPLAPCQPLLTMQPGRKSICPRLQRKSKGGRGRDTERGRQGRRIYCGMSSVRARKGPSGQSHLSVFLLGLFECFFWEDKGCHFNGFHLFPMWITASLQWCECDAGQFLQIHRFFSSPPDSRALLIDRSQPYEQEPAYIIST